MADYTSISEPLGDALKALVGAGQGQARGVHLGRGVFHVPQFVATTVCGKLDGALGAGGSATLSVWRLKDGETDWLSQSEDTGEDVTVYAPPVLRTGSIAVGKWVEAKWTHPANGEPRYEVAWAEC